MEPLKRHRSALKRSFTRILNLTKNENVSKELLQNSLVQIREFEKEANNLQKQMLSECASTEDEEEILDYFDDLLTRQMELQAELDSRLACNNSEIVRTNSVNSVRLPKISLPQFSGVITEWPSFKDIFQNVVGKDQTISGSQRMQYLRSSLSGVALQLIKSLTITDDNYELAWKTLENRYSHKREQVTSQIKNLVALRSATTESPGEIRRILDCATEVVSTLENLRGKSELGNDLVVFLVTERLDSATLKAFNLSLKDKEPAEMETLFEFLENRARALTLAAPASTTTSSVQVGLHKQFHNKQTKHNVKAMTASATVSNTCVVCSQPHQVFSCPKFLSLKPVERKDVVTNKGLCFNCLSCNHKVTNCSSGGCKQCGRKHNTLLHFDREGETNRSGNKFQPRSDLKATAPTFQARNYTSNAAETSVTDSAVHSAVTTHSSIGANSCTLDGKLVLLQTALVHIKDRYGQNQLCRLLLDSGSMVSFVNNSFAERLGLKRHPIDVTLKGIGATNAGTCKTAVNLQLTSIWEPEFSINFEAITLPKVTEDQPQCYVSDDSWRHLRRLPLADPDCNVPRAIDIILGVQICPLLPTGQFIPSTNTTPAATQTHLGWVLSGSVPVKGRFSEVMVHHSSVSVDEMLQKFWELDSVPQVSTLTKDELQAEDYFVQTHSRNEAGRYIVRLPLNDKFSDLGESRKVAEKRFHHTEMKLQKDSELAEQYCNFMKEYEQLEHMQIAETTSCSSKQFFIPHHAVFKFQNQERKIRVVFDGSTRTDSGVSLNDCLLVGPRINTELFDIIIKFRRHPIALSGDIVKMFRQVLVDPRDRPLQTILWRNSIDDPISQYELNTVTYGLACSPYLCSRVLKQLAEDEGHDFPMAKVATQDEFYMDDLLSGGASVQQVSELKQQLSGLLARGGFEMSRWMSNSPDVLDGELTPHSERELAQSLDLDSTVKLLGVKWHPESDTLRIAVPDYGTYSITTKRVILSQLARQFDPIGLLTPMTVTAKILVQQLWKHNLDWDQPVPEAVACEWQNYLDQLAFAREVAIPRYVGNLNHPSAELHAFCDSSEKAYAITIYSRTWEDGSYKTALVASKSKVAPIKTLSIPRLELCGAVLLANVVSRVCRVLNFPQEKVNAWTDSQIVLAWLKEYPCNWTTFVANRVSHIQQTIPGVVWRHVRSEDNPADIASRGLSIGELLHCGFWWNGPQFLSKEIENYTTPSTIISSVPERKISKVVSSVATTSSPLVSTLLETYSGWTKVRRILSYILRFISNASSASGPKFQGPLSHEELRRAEQVIVKEVQFQHFPRELEALGNGAPLPKSSSLQNLDPFLDHFKVMRVGGRLHNSSLGFTQKHPFILPHQSRLSNYIIDYHHLNLMHAGPKLTLSSIRQTCWILKGASAIRSRIHRCVTCFRQRASGSVQLMAPLPAPRVTPNSVFKHVGIDFAGPVMLKASRGRRVDRYKGYFLVFVCLATKAVHLEATTGLSSQDFIAALRRFVSRRGICSDIYSDNGGAFKGADPELRKLLRQSKVLQSPEAQRFLTENSITFHFISPLAPHQGGIWERCVRSVKVHLVRQLGTGVWTYEELSTGLTQIEALLNSRPLTPLTENIEELNALTPGHFLIGSSLTTLPEPSLLDTKVNNRDRYQLIQRVVQQFWKVWKTQYLHQLQQRPKWTQRTPNLQAGDMVILRDEQAQPTHWPLARIVEVYPGRDGLVRNVLVKTASGSYKRSISSVAKLPVDSAETPL